MDLLCVMEHSGGGGGGGVNVLNNSEFLTRLYSKHVTSNLGLSADEIVLYLNFELSKLLSLTEMKYLESFEMW